MKSEMNKSEMSDGERLRQIASLFDDYNMNLPITRKKVQADLRRIASDIDRKEALKPLTGNEQKAFDAFVEVCNEPIPEGMGKEYMNGMIKMKAFMAGRAMEYEHAQQEIEFLKSKLADIDRKVPSDEEITKMFDERYPTMHSHQRQNVLQWFIDGAKLMRDKMTRKTE